MNIKELKVAISNIDNMDDLRVLNNFLVGQMRSLSRKATWSLQKGDQVTFKSRDGVTHTGVIEKVMQKNCRVKTATTTWKVAASFLKKVG